MSVGYDLRVTKRFCVDNEFNNIELLIRNAIDSIIKSKGTAREQIAKDKSVISEEVIRAKKSFVLKTLMLDGSVSLRRMVQFHQYSIMRLTDELTTIEEHDLDGFYGGQTEVLLLFLQSRFREYFDMDAMLPEIHRKKSVASTKQLYGEIVIRLSGNEPDNKTWKENSKLSDPISGTYVREYSFKVVNPETGADIGIRTIRDTIFVEPGGDHYQVTNRKWATNDYDAEGWRNMQHSDDRPLASYSASFSSFDSTLNSQQMISLRVVALGKKLYKGNNESDAYIKLE